MNDQTLKRRIHLVYYIMGCAPKREITLSSKFMLYFVRSIYKLLKNALLNTKITWYFG